MHHTIAEEDEENIPEPVIAPPVPQTVSDGLPTLCESSPSEDDRQRRHVQEDSPDSEEPREQNLRWVTGEPRNIIEVESDDSIWEADSNESMYTFPT